MQAKAGPQVSLARAAPSGLRAPKPGFLFLAGASGALLIAYGVLGLPLLRLSQDFESVEANMQSAQSVLSKARAATEDLAPARREADAGLAAAQGAFPERFQSTPFLARLFALAETQRVTLTNIQNRPQKEQSVGQHKYGLTPVTIVAEGELPALVGFLDAIEKIQEHTLVAKTAQLTQVPGGVSLLLDVSIYSRPPGAAAPQGGNLQAAQAGR